VPGEGFKSVIFSIVFAVATAGFSGPLEAGLIDYFIIQYPSISPNGDGIKDSSTVRIGLLSACTELLVTVEDRSTGNPLDTLLRTENASPGTFSAAWRGQNSSGGLLAEGSYALHLLASSAAEAENLTRTVIVDTTVPFVMLDRIDPGIYAPNVPGTPDRVLIYFSISRYGEGDTLSLMATSPDSSTQRTPVAVSGDGAYSVEWSAPPTATDGMYRLTLFIGDEAGNSDADSGSVDVDTGEPALSFINPPSPFTNQVPLALSGKCYDRNGVEKDSLFWDAGASFLPDSTFMDGDTLVWRFDAVDSLRKGSGYDEGLHSLKIKCSDIFGHESEHTLLFSLDLTPPPAPTVNPLPAIVYKPEISISGSVDKTNTKSVLVYRTAGTDRKVTRREIITTGFSVQDTLREGKNSIWAAAQDEAGNTSENSATQTVTYAIAAGISHPEVFRVPDVFRIYAKRPVRAVKIEIYTVSGELVATLSKPGPGTDFELPWNLTNNDGETVRNGPYLVAFTVTYADGQTMEKRLIAVVQ
jgi:flagellar hook assembly protein FlgD